MILVDTSVWILVLRDSNGRYAKKLRALSSLDSRNWSYVRGLAMNSNGLCFQSTYPTKSTLRHPLRLGRMQREFTSISEGEAKQSIAPSIAVSLS